MSEKWWPHGAWDLYPGFFYMAQIRDMRPIILLPFRRKACWGFFYHPLKPDLPYFSAFSHKRHDFLEKVIELKMRVLIFSATFV
jgi:hypothetical protein